MKGISIRQPWAYLIVNGFKDIENRTWRLPKALEGQNVLILSSAAPIFIADVAQGVLEDARAAMGYDPDRYFTLPAMGRGAGGIVGVAKFGPATRSADSAWAAPDPKMWHWTITDARPLPFIPCKGRLGFFDVPPEALSAALSAVAGGRG